MGDMTVDELKDKNLWFLWSAKPGKNGKVTKVHSQQMEELQEQMMHIRVHGYLLMMQNQPEISFGHRGLA